MLLRSRLLYEIVNQIVADLAVGQLFFYLLYTEIHRLDLGLLGDSCYKF